RLRTNQYLAWSILIVQLFAGNLILPHEESLVLKSHNDVLRIHVIVLEYDLGWHVLVGGWVSHLVSWRRGCGTSLNKQQPAMSRKRRRKKKTVHLNPVQLVQSRPHILAGHTRTLV